MTNIVKALDLFSGLGGMRIGLEQACIDLGLSTKCVGASEVKDYAIDTYLANFPSTPMLGDITDVDFDHVLDFDILLAGFPCQPFSTAGKRLGFLDPRGGMFEYVLRALRAKHPRYFLLENVEGLATHDNGKTITLMTDKLKALGYHVTTHQLDSSHFGVAQRRKRIYFVGSLTEKTIELTRCKVIKPVRDCVEQDVIPTFTSFSDLLLRKFSHHQLQGKVVSDKRGGGTIHSWDIDYHGETTASQKRLMEAIMRGRRSKQVAKERGVPWRDGVALTVNEIDKLGTFSNLEADLSTLRIKGYLSEEPTLIKGIWEVCYNIRKGKLSFPFTTILDLNSTAPTLVASEAGRVAIALKGCVRPISIREGLNLSGFPENYGIPPHVTYRQAFDLIGNTVTPPVIKELCYQLLKGKDCQ